jgi:hypothetical protein
MNNPHIPIPMNPTENSTGKLGLEINQPATRRNDLFHAVKYSYDSRWSTTCLDFDRKKGHTHGD